MSGKKYVLTTVTAVILGLAVIAGVTAWIDPLFHFRGPRDGVAYSLLDENYQNDGILRHYEYDAVITGTSMTQNFKPSEFDELFGTNSVKVSLSGGRFWAFDRQAQVAFSKNPQLKYYVQSLDDFAIEEGADTQPVSEPLEYLYDEKWTNDIQYLLNKQILLKNTAGTILQTLTGGETTSRDAYTYWNDEFIYGPESVFERYTRPEKNAEAVAPSDIEKVKKTMDQYFVSMAKEHPDTQFYLFFPPYSIVCWDERNQTGMLQHVLDERKAAVETLLGYDNIHVFAFDDNVNMICDLDNYKDPEHYGGWVNSQMLVWMRNGEHELTQENYLDYFDRMQAFYTSYDYESLCGDP